MPSKKKNKSTNAGGATPSTAAAGPAESVTSQPTAPTAAASDEAFSAQAHFCALLDADKSKSATLAAIETLHEALCQSNARTIQGLTGDLHSCVKAMVDTDHTTTSLRSATELFMRFISLNAVDEPDFTKCMTKLTERAEQFIGKVRGYRDRIAVLSLQFMRPHARVLTHSFSRCVLECIKHAHKHDVPLHVMVTESRPDYSGDHMRKQLTEHGIEAVVVLDAAAAYVMEQIDFVLVGAEGVVETGGIINKIGTLGICQAAAALNKPVYVACESVKFMNTYPLNQRDVPDEFKYATSVLQRGDLTREHPTVDYTPPRYLQLLFTDRGILTPAAVSEELINLYL